jgi:hypothetical protein
MRWVYPQIFNPLGYANLIALLIVGLFLQEVHLVLPLVLVSVVPESGRHGMILIRKQMLQELVSVRKLLPIQLILEIWCRTCKS